MSVRLVIYCFFFFYLASFEGHGQTFVSGKIQNPTKPQLLKGVNILLQSKKDSGILAFAVSQEDGSFSLTIDSSLDSIWLVAKSLTIENIELKISNETQVLRLDVKESELEIEEFILEGIKSPISQKKDTLSYDIESFKSQSDKTLIDVLQRLPGIEINSNGTINYKGEAIQKFYIEGLDLLEGRYNLATQNMPVDAVKSVEVLENHQPIKMLEEREFSSKSSINIRLKRKNVILGRGYAEGGFPGIWDAKVAPMIFSNDFQSIVSLGFNNAGRLLSDEIENLGSDSFQSKENLQNQWFRPSGIRRDSGSGDRFIFNKSTLASVNTIKKRSDNFHIKTALDFSSEDFNNSYQVRKSYFLESGRLDFLESGFFKEKRDHFNLNVNMIKNSSVDFFSNQFGIGIFNTKSISDLVFQSQSLDQRIKSPDFLISNIFKKLIDIKSGIVDINSTSFFMVQSPELLTSPPFLGILQDSSMQSGMSFQKVRYLLYDFNNSLTLKGLRFLNLSSSSAVGIKARNSSLESASFLGDELLGFSFQNNLTLQEVAGLTSVSFEKNTESIKAKVIIPVKYIHYKLRDVFENKVLDEVNQVIIEPEAFLNFDFNPSLSFRNFISRKVSIGSLYDLYPGQIFVNYQTVQVKDAPVPLIKSNKLSFSQNFKDPLYSLFLNSSISLGLNSRNTLMKSEVEDSGLVRLRAIARDNIEKSFSWNGDGSKYFPTVRTTMAIGSSYNWIFREFAINESFQFLNYYRWNGFLKAVYRKVGKVNFELKYDYSSIRSIAEESFDNSLFLSSPSISIFVFPDDNQNLKLTFEALAINSISGSSNTSVSFLDFAYNYKVPEKKIEFSVIGANLLGQNRLTSVSNSSFIFIEESRVLRPRQVTFRIEYSF